MFFLGTATLAGEIVARQCGFLLIVFVFFLLCCGLLYLQLASLHRPFICLHCLLMHWCIYGDLVKFHSRSLWLPLFHFGCFTFVSRLCRCWTVPQPLTTNTVEKTNMLHLACENSRGQRSPNVHQHFPGSQTCACHTKTTPGAPNGEPELREMNWVRWDLSEVSWVRWVVWD